MGWDSTTAAPVGGVSPVGSVVAVPASGTVFPPSILFATSGRLSGTSVSVPVDRIGSLLASDAVVVGGTAAGSATFSLVGAWTSCIGDMLYSGLGDKSRSGYALQSGINKAEAQ